MELQGFNMYFQASICTPLPWETHMGSFSRLITKQNYEIFLNL